MLLPAGDGECQEGQCGGPHVRAHYKQNRFIVFVDQNAKQLDGPTEKCMNLGDCGKFEEFRFNAVELKDGHDVAAICAAVEDAKKQETRPRSSPEHHQGEGRPRFEEGGQRSQHAPHHGRL